MQQNKRLWNYKKLHHLYEGGAVFTAFDTETTGLRPIDSTIIEIGAVRFDRSGVISTWSSLFNPGVTLHPKITEITHITDRMLASAPALSEKISDFIGFLGQTIIVAHNARFDIEFLNSECARNGLNRTSNDYIDTLQFARTAFPQMEHHRLGFLADALGIDKGNSHRALDDAMTCMGLLIKCMYPDGGDGQQFLF